jgi:hypothetical protein
MVRLGVMVKVAVGGAGVRVGVAEGITLGSSGVSLAGTVGVSVAVGGRVGSRASVGMTMVSGGPLHPYNRLAPRAAANSRLRNMRRIAYSPTVNTSMIL